MSDSTQTIGTLMPICDLGCGSVLTMSPSSYSYLCAKCGERPADGVMNWNKGLRLVWLRSKHIVYSSEVVKGRLLPNGEVRGVPGVTWEKWG